MNTMVTISKLQRVGMYPMAISRSIKKVKTRQLWVRFFIKLILMF